MLAPPGERHSLKRLNQFCNGTEREDGGFASRFRGKMGASDRHVTVLTGKNFNLTVTHISGQMRESG